MPKADRDIAESMLESLKRKGIEIRLNAYALSVYDTADGITLTYTDNSDDTPYFWEGDALLLATGRRPMTDGLNLHAAGIRTDTRGAVIVNEHLQTTSPHIWAMGDVRGGSLCMTIYPWMISALSPTGCSAIKSERPMTGFRCSICHFYRSAVGAYRHDRRGSRKRGYSLQVSRLPAAAIPRARTLQQIDGMMKAIVNAHTGRIIGCTLFCIDAPEVINLVSLAMKNDLHYSILRISSLRIPV